METQYLAWTARTCAFSGAGVYVGFAPRFEHEVVGHKLNQRQVRVFNGGVIVLRPDQVSPLVHYALRDPSAVKVKPIDRSPIPDGGRHVYLVFDFPNSSTGKPADAVPVKSCDTDAVQATLQAHLTGQPAFIMTIGLPVGHEEAFHQKVVCADPKQTLDELCRRIVDLGRFGG